MEPITAQIKQTNLAADLISLKETTDYEDRHFFLMTPWRLCKTKSLTLLKTNS